MIVECIYTDNPGTLSRTVAVCSPFVFLYTLFSPISPLPPPSPPQLPPPLPPFRFPPIAPPPLPLLSVTCFWGSHVSCPREFTTKFRRQFGGRRCDLEGMRECGEKIKRDGGRRKGRGEEKRGMKEESGGK